MSAGCSLKEQEIIPSKLICSSIPTDISKGVEFTRDPGNGLRCLSFKVFYRRRVVPTVATIDVSSMMRRQTRVMAAVTLKSLKPVNHCSSWLAAGPVGSLVPVSRPFSDGGDMFSRSPCSKDCRLVDDEDDADAILPGSIK